MLPDGLVKEALSGAPGEGAAWCAGGAAAGRQGAQHGQGQNDCKKPFYVDPPSKWRYPRLYGDCGLPLTLRRPSETGVASEALPSPKSRGALRWRLEGALNLRKGSPEAPGVLWKKTCRPDSGAPERALRRIRWAPPVGRRSSPDRACGIGSSRRRSTGPPRDIF